MTKAQRAPARQDSCDAPHQKPMLRIGVLNKDGGRRPPVPLPTARCARGARGEDAAKRKGGPVPGTPSPMRTRLSADLHDHARRLYETTGQYVSTIALDVGVDESVIRRMAKREGWVRYVAPPRDLPPVAKLLAQVEELEKSSADPRTPTDSRCSASAFSSGRTAAEGRLCPSPHSSPDGERPLAFGGGEQEARAKRGEQEENIARFTQVVMAHLDEFEAVRRAGKLIARQHLPTARAISILTEAFNKLQRLRAAQPGQNHDDSYDMPADLDAFRDALAQKIENFLASRRDAEAFADPDAARNAAPE